eukprot:5266234-Pleurochrysis_carterae.AAC.1
MLVHARDARTWPAACSAHARACANRTACAAVRARARVCVRVRACRCIGLVCDIRSTAAAAAAVQAGVDAFGKIDLCWNNAGIQAKRPTHAFASSAR